VRWKHDPKQRTAPREQFRPALIAGTRYVWHSPHIRKLLLRTILFTIPAQAIWALLPLVAKRQLGLDVGAYGILLGALGVGAIAGAMSLPRLRAVWQTNVVVGIAMFSYAIAEVALSFTSSVWQAVPLLAIAGFGWIGTLSTIGGSLQLYLPSWVRSRGVAINTVVLFGGQAIGAALWGYFATVMTLQQSYWLAGALIALASTVARIVPLTQVETLDRSHADYWPEPHAQLSDEELEGTVLVSIEYDVDPGKLQEFLDAMAYVRVVRIRTGGMQWALNRDVERPERFIETYTAGSWEEHMRQHHSRLTESDRQHEARANACAVRPPRVEHFVQTTTRRL
jgi:MFS family permease